MMRDALYLAVRSLWFYRGRSLTIICCLALTFWLPLTVRLLLDRFQAEITARADQTPLVIGSRGSRIDLALKALYYNTVPPDPTMMAEAEFVRDTGYATDIPLHVNYVTQAVNGVDGVPIVGTTIEYFEFRKLSVQQGTGLQMLGDCVLGSRVAKRMQLQPGDHILSAPRNAFNLAGDYPLRLNITGVLSPAHSPDDDAVFVDIRTTWIIDGIGHGHQELNEETDSDLLLEQSKDRVTASAAVLPYTRITPDNVASFHFHGDESTFPITALIAVPYSDKDRTLLLGEYLSTRRETALCVRPGEVVQSLFRIVFRVERVIQLSSLLSVAVTGLMMSLVIFLSVRLRTPEMRTMFRLGCSRLMISVLIGTEVAILVVGGVLLALAGAWTCQTLAADSLKSLLF